MDMNRYISESYVPSSPHNLLCFLTKLVVTRATTLEQAYAPVKKIAVDAKRSTFHCLPETKTANAAETRVKM